jgi:L-ascorbate metabolism protein UlaG (beta-lactamase superfamily)
MFIRRYDMVSLSRMRQILLLLAFLLSVQVHSMSWKIQPLEDLRRDVNAQVNEYIASFPQDELGVSKAKAHLSNDANAADSRFWIKSSLELSQDILRRHPLSPDNESIRKAAFLILDYPIHVNEKAKAEPEIKDLWEDIMMHYHGTAMTRAAESIRNTTVPAGKMAIWKIYNMGFVVKTANHCVGFDLARPLLEHNRRLELNRSMSPVLDQIEVLFLSHIHGDHMQHWVCDYVATLGKPIIAPETWADQKNPTPHRNDSRFTYAWEDAIQPRTLSNGIQYRALPGHQGKTRNSVFVVTLDGITVMQTGDNTDATIATHFPALGRVDILIVACWARMLQTAKWLEAHCRADGKAPQFLISAHENEVGHPPTNRESFQETYQRLGDRSKIIPSFVFDVGEGVLWPDGNAP